jgi:hypothetical protein
MSVQLLVVVAIRTHTLQPAPIQSSDGKWQTTLPDDMFQLISIQISVAKTLPEVRATHDVLLLLVSALAIYIVYTPIVVCVALHTALYRVTQARVQLRKANSVRIVQPCSTAVRCARFMLQTFLGEVLLACLEVLHDIQVSTSLSVHYCTRCCELQYSR